MDHSGNDLKDSHHVLGLHSSLTANETIGDSQEHSLHVSSLGVSQDHDHSQGSQGLHVSLDHTPLSASSNAVPALLSLSTEGTHGLQIQMGIAPQKITPTKKQKKDKEIDNSPAAKSKRQRTGYSPKSIPKTENESELWKLKLPELREILKANSMPTTGNKDVLIGRIMQHCESDPTKVKNVIGSVLGNKIDQTASIPLSDSTQDDPSKSPTLNAYTYGNLGMMGY